MEQFHISDLASEILLFIFLHLDLNQLVVCRGVNKQFQEIIDNNQLLWRIFEWEQKDHESFRPALDMFDEKSRSSLEKVSIQEKKSKEEDLLNLIQVLGRSKETLREVTLKVFGSGRFESQIIELMTAERLRSLVVWRSERYTGTFPLARLASPKLKGKTSSIGQLQLLWVYDGVGKVDSKHLKSLISFAQGEPIDAKDCRELISNFSGTVVHLRLRIRQQVPRTEPLFCPNLKIFEVWILGGRVSSFFNAPQLRIIVLEAMMRSDLERLPSSVEEIWLRSRSESLALAEEWEPLFRHCPKLRILKLTEEFVSETLDFPSFDFTGISGMLQARKQMVQDGKEIDGIKIASLQKLILPTGMLDEEDLKRAAEVSKEVIDIKDHPEFIEIQY